MFGYVNRKRNQKGFTLMEMLIVVAIIAILVAVSIPIFTSQLEKSREATDIANMRAAKAEALADFLTNYPDNLGDGTNSWDTGTAGQLKGFYNAGDGVIASSNTGIIGYGKGTAVDGKTAAYVGYDNGTEYAGQVIQVIVYTADVAAAGTDPAIDAGTVEVTWVEVAE